MGLPGQDQAPMAYLAGSLLFYFFLHPGRPLVATAGSGSKRWSEWCPGQVRGFIWDMT